MELLGTIYEALSINAAYWFPAVIIVLIIHLFYLFFYPELFSCSKISILLMIPPTKKTKTKKPFTLSREPNSR